MKSLRNSIFIPVLVLQTLSGVFCFVFNYLQKNILGGKQDVRFTNTQQLLGWRTAFWIVTADAGLGIQNSGFGDRTESEMK